MTLDYTQAVLRRFRKPKNAREMKNPSAVGKVGNPQCGDVMQLFLKIKDGKIKDASFKTFGCVAAISTSDVLCDIIKGKTIKKALKVTAKDIIKKLGTLPSVKVHCSVLGREALHAAVKNYEKSQSK